MSKSIKFSHAENGYIEVSQKGSAINSLFAIGAVALSAKAIYKNDHAFYQYETDEKGLNDLISLAGDNLDTLHESIRALGVLLACAETEVVSEELKSIGWLISSLSDLASYVDEQQGEFQHSLKSQGKESVNA